MGASNSLIGRLHSINHTTKYDSISRPSITSAATHHSQLLSPSERNFIESMSLYYVILSRAHCCNLVFVVLKVLRYQFVECTMDSKVHYTITIFCEKTTEHF